MPDYYVTWEINIAGAASPEDAARQAFALVQKPGTTANVFDVHDETGEVVRIDITELDEQAAS